MSLIAIFFSFLFGLLFSFSGISGTQAKARDIERKNDINNMHVQLEIYYNDNGDYPTEENMVLNYDQKLPRSRPRSIDRPKWRLHK